MNDLAERISDSELEIMQVLWSADDALSITEIRETIQQSKGWSATTIGTLVQRLCAKGVVKQEKRKVFYYSPMVTRNEYSAWTASRLISRLYSGSVKNLMAALVSAEGLKQEDVEELRSFFHERYEE